MLRAVLASFPIWAALSAASVAAPPPLEAYGRLPRMERVNLSPSGERYAMIAEVDGKRRLIVSDTDKRPLFAGEIGDAKVQRLVWAGDDRLVLISSATVSLGLGFVQSKAELGAATTVNLTTRQATSIFDRKQARVANTIHKYLGSVQKDGRWYGYFAGFSYEPGGGRLKTGSDGRLHPDLYKVDLDTGAFSMAAESRPSSRDWLVAPDGRVVARLDFASDSGQWTVRGPGISGTVLGEGRDPMGGVDLIGFGRTPETVLIGLEDGGREVVREVSLQDGSTLAAFDPEVHGAPLSHDETRLWIGTRPGGEPQSYVLFDPKGQARLAAAMKAFPGYIARPVSWNDGYTTLVVFTAGGDDSGTYWLIKFDGGKGAASPIGFRYPAIRPDQVGPVRWFDYKAADGLELRGVLTLPPGERRNKPPLVVLPHGGPASSDSPGFDYMAQAFASRGYVVLQPNFRGSTGGERTLLDAGVGEWGRKMQSDVSDGVAELARQGIIDPARVCIVGASYGGYAALAGVTIQQGLYRCAVSIGGVTDLATMLSYIRQQTGSVSPAVRRWRAYMPRDAGRAFEEFSPARLAGRADAPVLLIHGQDDTIVPIDQSRRMEKALRAGGKPVEFIALRGADHWLLHEESRIATLKAAVEFVMKHNPPDAAEPATP